MVIWGKCGKYESVFDNIVGDLTKNLLILLTIYI